MAKSKTVTGKYDLRIVILRRALGAAGDNNERPATWPEPATGTGEYYAARLGMSAGETIAQSVKEALGTMKLSIKGRAIPVETEDRVRKKYTGELFSVVGVMRDSTDTILMVERVHQQTVGQ